MSEPLTVYGTREVAKWCGVSRPAVDNWLSRHSTYPEPLVRLVQGDRVILGWGLEQRNAWRAFSKRRYHRAD